MNRFRTEKRDGREGGVLVIVLVLAVLAFVGLTVMFVRQAKSATEEVVRLKAKVARLEEETKAAGGKKEAAAEKKEPAAAEKAPGAGKSAGAKAEELKSEVLSRQMEEMRSANAELQQKAGELEEEKKALKEELLATSGTLTQAKAEANRLKEEKAGLLKDLKDADSELRQHEADLEDAQALLKKAETESDSLQAEVKRNMAAIADLSEKIKENEAKIAELSAALAEYPSEPFADDKAQAKFDEIVAGMKDEQDADKRVAALFGAKVLLAGSKCEREADGMWQREVRARQAAIDRAAPGIYREVSAKVRAQPDAHAENVKLLSEALRKVKGSRYERNVQDMLDAEMEAKAAEGEAAETGEEAAPEGD